MILTTPEDILNVFSVLLLVWQVCVDSTNNPHREENWLPLIFLLADSEKSFLLTVSAVTQLLHA